MQRALLQWRRPDKRALVIKALMQAGREDLIGYGKECLIHPRPDEHFPHLHEKKKQADKPARHGGAKPRKTVSPSAREQKRPAPRRKAGWAKPKKKR